MTTLSRDAYAAMYGPTTGDRIRLADTELWIEVERDDCVGGDEAVFGGGKVIRESMGQSGATRAEGSPDLVITGAVILDHWGIVKADIGGEIIDVGHSDDSAPVKATLDYRERRVTFRFAALDFASPSKNIYRYRLGGFEDVWRDSGEYPQATYTNLPAGSYTFEAMAANNDGLASERPAQIELHVAPAPWRTGWAYVSYGAFLGAVILAIWRHQRRKVRMAAEQRRELSRKVDERTRDLKKANVELETVNAKLVEASVTDSLTGLKNRRYLDTVIEDRISAIDRRCNEHGAPPSPQIAFDISPRMFFMMIDLDGFKDINDDHGHHAGDKALIQVSDILRSCCRPTDLLIRWGGDEFLFLLPACDHDQAARFAEQLRQLLFPVDIQPGEGSAEPLCQAGVTGDADPTGE